MELRQYCQILLKRLWLILLLPLLAGGACMYLNYYVLEPVYESNVTIYVMNKTMFQLPESAYGELGIAKQLVKDYKEIIRSRKVTSAVVGELKLTDLTPELLAKKISVNAVSDTRILEIRVEDKDPARAKILVDKVGAVFKDEIVELMRVDNVSIIDAGVAPVKPVKPNKTRNIAIAAFSGLMAAIGLAFLLEYLDDTVKNAEDLERHLGIAVLGIVPAYNIK